jgi:diadenosine tetraphosphate (Ap4A) HIT family hydrolase
MADERASARSCGVCGFIEKVRAGAFPDFLAELPHSFVILGDRQFYRGYCVLLAKHHAAELHMMPPDEVQALFRETVAVGAAIASAVKPVKLNHECLGNLEPHVHWHVIPRYVDDPMRHAPVWVRAEAETKIAPDESDRRELIAQLRAEIARRIPHARFEPQH